MDWYPWCEEAFAKARKEDKPIFLSIGYSTCHWCHVMARESFENEEIAEILNQHFVSIKVDREDQPEVDHLYMRSFTEVMGEQGGWPLSMWLTPELKPFLGGTYFPPTEKFGLPSFPVVLHTIAKRWQANRPEFINNAEAVAQNIQLINSVSLTGDLNKGLIVAAFAVFEQSFDPIYGGLRGAPKFPQPSVLSFLLRYHYRTRSPQALAMVELQLQKMAQGGCYDHLGGGFARYCQDEEWIVPHFEKMLYDNALLLGVYAQAYQITGKDLYRQVVRETADYLLQDMQSLEGGFYAAEDAESEGLEGKFYVWQKKEIEAVLGEEAPLFCEIMEVSDQGNWSDSPIKTAGLNILHKKQTMEEFADSKNMPLQKLRKSITQAKQKLLHVRNQRVRPGKDDKVLVSWNGLAISSMAYAGRAIGEEKYLQAARRAATFILDHLYTNKRLIHRWRQGEAKGSATLEDYAYFVTGLLDLYEATFEETWLKFAHEINQTMITLFYDEKEGGFYLTEEDRSDLFSRYKEATDRAIPSANSVAVLNCLRLYHMFGEDQLRDCAQRTLFAFGALLEKHSTECPTLLVALDALLSPNREIVLAGETRAMKAMLDALYLPDSVMLHADTQTPLTTGKVTIAGKATAYVCKNFTCRQPVTDVDTLKQQLEDDEK